MSFVPALLISGDPVTALLFDAELSYSVLGPDERSSESRVSETESDPAGREARERERLLGDSVDVSVAYYRDHWDRILRMR